MRGLSPTHTQHTRTHLSIQRNENFAPQQKTHEKRRMETETKQRSFPASKPNKPENFHLIWRMLRSILFQLRKPQVSPVHDTRVFRNQHLPRLPHSARIHFQSTKTHSTQQEPTGSQENVVFSIRVSGGSRVGLDRPNPVQPWFNPCRGVTPRERVVGNKMCVRVCWCMRVCV